MHLNIIPNVAYMEENVYDTLPSMRMLEIGVKIRMSDIGGAISRWKDRKGGNLMMGRFGLFVGSIFLIGTNQKTIRYALKKKLRDCLGIFPI